MRRPLAILALCIGLAQAGCATVESGGFKVDRADTERAFDQVRARAAWDFRCADDSLTLVVLAVFDGGTWNDYPAQIGVTGCGVRAVYVSTSRGWLLNGFVR